MATVAVVRTTEKIILLLLVSLVYRYRYVLHVKDTPHRAPQPDRSRKPKQLNPHFLSTSVPHKVSLTNDSKIIN